MSSEPGTKCVLECSKQSLMGRCLPGQSADRNIVSEDNACEVSEGLNIHPHYLVFDLEYIVMSKMFLKFNSCCFVFLKVRS